MDDRSGVEGFHRVLDLLRGERQNSGAGRDQGDLFKESNGGADASGVVQGKAPGVTISGVKTMDVVLQEISQLSQEIGTREEALTEASSRIEGLILKGSERLSHQWKLIYGLCKGLEKKGDNWKAERDQRRRDISDQEQ